MIPAHIPFELSGPVSVFGSFYGALAQQQRAIAGVQASTVVVAQLSEISADMGEIRAGSFITENLYPAVDDSTGYTSFSGYGVIMAGEAWTLEGTDYWNLGGFSDGAPSTLQFGLSATTGAAKFAGGIAAIDITGMRFSEDFDAIVFNQASYKSAPATFKMGMGTGYGVSTGSGRFLWHTKAAGAELLTNGDFELGAFTNWTAVGTTWSIDSAFKYAGSYSAKCVRATGTPTQTSDRMDIQDAVGIEVSGFVFVSPNNTTFPSLSLKLYNKPSGGDLITTVAITVGQTVNQWQYFNYVLPSGVGAGSVELVLNAPTATDEECWFDNLSVKAISGAFPISQLSIGYGNTYHSGTNIFAPYNVMSCPTHSGAGLDDMSVSGAYTGPTRRGIYKVTIDGEAAPDTVKVEQYDTIATSWATLSTGTAITGAAQSLGSGLSFKFAATTGHTLADEWLITASVNYPIGAINPSGNSIFLLDNDGVVALKEQASTPPTPLSGFGAVYPKTDGSFYSENDAGIEAMLLPGEMPASVSFANTSSAQTIISKTVEANTLGTKGSIHTRVVSSYFNNSGSSYSFIHTYNFGTYSMAYAAVVRATHATGFHMHIFDVWTFNDAATNSQVHIMRHIENGRTDNGVWNTDVLVESTKDISAVDTTADITVSVTGTMSGAHANTSFKALGKIIGPVTRS